MSAGEVPTRAGRREWLGLATLALPTFVVAIDLFVLLLALPKLSADLGADSNQQLWTTDMYGFLLAGFLVTMGTLGDRIGRRKLLLIGAAAFAGASLLAAYSVNPEMLIASRALLGIAGATLGPSTLALIANIFRDPRQQATAFGLWGMTFTLGALLGPVIGGVLLEHFWWGSVFLLGVPVMLLVLILGPRLLPEYRNPSPGRLDPASVVLSLIALLATIYGIKQLARDGWDARYIAAVVIGLAVGAIFLRRQRRLADPLLDLDLFKIPSISTCLSGQLSYTIVGGGVMLFMALYFQLVQGMSTLQAGLAMVPGMAGGAVGFTIGPKLAAKYRPGYVIAAGLVGVAAVLVVFTQVGPGAVGATTLILGFAVMACCGAPMAGLGTNLVVGSAPMEKMGSAGSLAQMANEFGGTLGIALLGTLGTAVYRHEVAGTIPAGIPADAAAATRDSIAGAATAAHSLPDQTAATLLAPAHQAFANGLNVMAAVGAVLLGCIAVLVATRLRQVPPIGQAMGGGEAPAAPAEPAAPGTPAALDEVDDIPVAGVD
jgi:MFS transporter, DHA2 family, multidrug resistance protein